MQYLTVLHMMFQFESLKFAFYHLYSSIGFSYIEKVVKSRTVLLRIRIILTKLCIQGSNYANTEPDLLNSDVIAL